jgi:hypothetical protein
VAEGGGLLNRYTGKTVSEVRILSSPPEFFKLLITQQFFFAYSDLQAVAGNLEEFSQCLCATSTKAIGSRCA